MAKNNAKEKIIEKLNNGELIKENDALYIKNPNYFLTFSDLVISDGIDIIENIIILSKEYIDSNKKSNEKLNDVELMEITEKYKEINNIEGGYISQSFDKLDYIINSYEDITIITVISNDLEVHDFIGDLKIVNSSKGFFDSEINISQIILINRSLSPKLLIQLYKIAIKEKVKFFESLQLPLHINNILNNNDFLVIGSNLPEENLNQEYIEEIGFDIINMEYDDDSINLNEFTERIKDAVTINCEDALEKIKLNIGILDYFVSEGLLIGDLIEAGTEIIESIENREKLKEKLEKQLFESIMDKNVNALLMSAIRLEKDLKKGRIREINLKEKTNQFYPDKIIGFTIANQIGGTKALLNFKKYCDLKPGILYGLGPILSSTFAGLISGCITKVIEDN